MELFAEREAAVKLGLFMMPLHDPRRDYATVLNEDREAVILADRLGFAEAWIGEHYSTTAEGITAPLVFLASLIASAPSIRFGTGVLNLPLHHPARVAGDVALFDHLCGGRFLMGIGPGGLSTDFELFERTDPAARGPMMLECIDTVLKIWAGAAPYDIAGKTWNVRVTKTVRLDHGVGAMIKPLQRPHPPIATSITSRNSHTARVAGERGWIPLSANFVPPSNLRTHWQAYAAGAEAKGRQPDPALWRVARSILVTDDDAQAAGYLADPRCGMRFYFDYLYRNAAIRPGGMNNFKTHLDMPDVAVTLDYMLDAMAIAGSPATVLDRLVALGDEIGPFGTLVMTAHDWDDAPLWRRSMALLAEQVMPRFAQHAAALRQKAKT